MRRLPLSVLVLAAGAALPAHAQTAAQVIDAVSPNSNVEKMANGEYPAMKRDGALVGAIQRAWDSSPGTAGVFVARYAPDQVIKVRLREFMTTTIVLPEWETIATHVVGDSHGFKVTKTQPHILVASASITGADTSLTVVGDSGRVYSFYVRSEGYNSPNIPDLTVFVKADAPPAPPAAAVPAGDAKASTQAAATAPKKTDAPKPAARPGSGLENPDYLDGHSL